MCRVTAHAVECVRRPLHAHSVCFVWLLVNVRGVFWGKSFVLWGGGWHVFQDDRDSPEAPVARQGVGTPLSSVHHVVTSGIGVCWVSVDNIWICHFTIYV
jgi:hypothetical protein